MVGTYKRPKIKVMRGVGGYESLRYKTVIFIAGSYKGSTDDFDSSSVGSSPAPAARYAGVAELA